MRRKELSPPTRKGRRVVLLVLASVFILALLVGWFMGRRPPRPMFSHHLGQHERRWRKTWAPAQPLMHDARPARAYCDRHHNIILFVTESAGLRRSPQRTRCTVGDMTCTITPETDANRLILVSYDQERGSMRVAKMQISAGLAGRVQQAYDHMPEEQSIIDLIMSQMSEQEADLCRAEYTAIQYSQEDEQEAAGVPGGLK